MTKSIIYYTDNRLGEPIFSAVQRKLLQSDRKSTRLNSSHSQISYAVFCLKKKKNSECEMLQVSRLPTLILLMFLDMTLQAPAVLFSCIVSTHVYDCQLIPEGL